MPTDKTLTDEELDAIERAVAATHSTTTLQADLRGILDRHRPKPTLPDTLEICVYLDKAGHQRVCLADDTPPSSVPFESPMPICTIYPNPERMMDPVTLAVEHGLAVERYSGCFRIYSSERRQLQRKFPLSRDGYHAALRKATEMASQRSA